jgi:hypothetical protein
VAQVQFDPLEEYHTSFRITDPAVTPPKIHIMPLKTAPAVFPLLVKSAFVVAKPQVEPSDRTTEPLLLDELEVVELELVELEEDEVEVLLDELELELLPGAFEQDSTAMIKTNMTKIPMNIFCINLSF